MHCIPVLGVWFDLSPWTTTSGLGMVEKRLFRGSISPGARKPCRNEVMRSTNRSTSCRPPDPYECTAVCAVLYCDVVHGGVVPHNALCCTVV